MLFTFSSTLCWIDVPGYYQNRVVRRIPGAVELVQHVAGGGVERWLGSQRIVGVRRAGEHVRVEPRDEFIGGVGQIARDFLLDRAAFLRPFGLRILRARQAGGVHVEYDIQILGRQRGEILGDRLLGVGVVVTAELRVDRRNLRAGQIRAATKQHVLLGMGHTRESGRSFVAADQNVVFHRYHRRDRITNDYDAEAIAKSGSCDVLGRRSSRLGAT